MAGTGDAFGKSRLLSYQLFGPPTNSLKSYDGPCVNLSKTPLEISTSNKNFNHFLPKTTSEKLKYCLVCYSNNVDQNLSAINLEDFNTFLKIVITSVKTSYNNLNDTKPRNLTKPPVLILNQLTDTSLYLCVTCNAACKNLLQMYQHMMKLEQEVNTFKAKFLSAIKLSKLFAHNEVTNSTEFYDEITDKIRTFIIGGEERYEIWNTIKKEKISESCSKIEETIVKESPFHNFDIDFNSSDDVSVDQTMRLDDDSMKSTAELNPNELGPKRRNKLHRKHKGKPGTKRFAIEDLKQAKSNKEYVKWRQRFGNKMSLNAYKKMRRQYLSKLQKVTETNGIPARSNIGKAGIKVNWVERDNGKLEYLGVEVIKNNDGTFSCGLCIHQNLKPSKTKKSIGDHIKRRHVGVSNGHSCDKCNARFFFYHLLKQHLEEKHVGIVCKICGLNFANRSNLTQHERVKHEGIKKNICEHCGKGFATVKDMTIHVRRHTGERPFICHLCPKTFIDKQSMKTHIRKKHTPDEKTDFKTNANG